MMIQQNSPEHSLKGTAAWPSNGPAPRRFAMGAVMAVCVALAGCAEKELVLPGKRENVRTVLQDSSDVPAAAVFENQTRAIALPAARANANWAQGTGTQDFRPAHPALSATPQLVWSANIGAGDSRKQRITADPVVSEGLIFTLDAGSLVTATNTSGATIWTKDVRPERDADGEASGGGVAAHEGVVYVSSSFGVLTALDAKTGAEKWVQRLDATGTGMPVIFDNMVYVLSGDDTGWAIEADTGRVAWQTGGAASLSNVLGGPAPVIADDFAIFAFGSGELQALFRRGGLRRWDASVLGERPGRALSKIDDITGSPVVSGNVVYAGNQAGRIIAFDAASGKRIWTADEGAIGPVWPAGDSVFAITDANALVRLDASDGSTVWSVKLPNFVKDKPKKISEVFAHHGPVLAGGRLIVTSNDGRMRSFDPTSGALVNSVEIPSGATTAPAIAGQTLYVVGSNGQLHAFR